MFPGTNPVVWRRLARWLLIIPVCSASLFAAYIAAQVLMIGGNDWVRTVDRSSLNLPIHVLLGLESVLAIFCLCTIWIVPTALATAFAAGWRWLTAMLWGVSIALIPTGFYVWSTAPGGSGAVSRTATIVGAAVLLLGSIRTLRNPRRVRAQGAWSA